MKEIEAHYKEWREYARSICKNDKFLADDLLHDTLIRLLEREKFNELVKQGKLDTYVRCVLFRAYIHKNSSFNSSIRLKDHQFTEYIEWFEEVHYDKVKTWIGAKLDNDVIYIAINRLPFFQKEVFTLWAMDGFSYSKLSEQTGISKDDLFQAVKESKKQLRRWLVKLR